MHVRLRILHLPLNVFIWFFLLTINKVYLQQRTDMARGARRLGRWRAASCLPISDSSQQHPVRALLQKNHPEQRPIHSTASPSYPPAQPSPSIISSGSSPTTPTLAHIAQERKAGVVQTHRILRHRIDEVHSSLQSLMLRHSLRKPRLDRLCELRASFIRGLGHDVRAGRLVAVAIRCQLAARFVYAIGTTYCGTPMTAASCTSG
jgi:hypothetical protein